VKTRKFLLMFLLVLACSLAATLASYFFHYVEQNIVDTKILYRGWPLYWMMESIPLWDYWPHASRAIWRYFQPLNFLIDTVFWLILFQLPSALYMYLGKAKKTNV